MTNDLAEQYPMPPFLAVGQPWPPVVHGVNYAEVFQSIRDNRELFHGIHTQVFAEHYKRLRPSTQGDATENRDPITMQELLARLAAAKGQTTFEQEIDLPQALSLLWADMIVSRPPRISAGVFAETAGAVTGSGQATDPGPAERAAIQRLTTDLAPEVHEALVEQSYAGDGVFVARWYPDTGAQVVAYPADQWIPWSASGDPKRVTAHILFTEQFAEAAGVRSSAGDDTVLSVEIHYRGLVRYRRYLVVGGKIARELEPVLPEGTQADQELPGVTEFLVQPFKNIATAGDWRGESDYNAIETLVAEFDVRSSQWGRLNDRFTAPTMYGPADILEMDERTGHWVYRTSPDGKYIPVGEGDPTPGYLIWDPRWEMQTQTWDRLMDAFFLVSGTTPAVFSIWKEGSGGGLSGIALRLRLARPLQVAGRKRERMEPALRRALLAAQQLEVGMEGSPLKATYKPTLPVFEWADGLPADPKEQAETEAMRVQAGISSRKRALMRLDGLSETEAEDQLDEIMLEEQAARQVAIPATGGGVDLNGPDGQAILRRARELMAQDDSLTEEQALARAREELGARGGDQ